VQSQTAATLPPARARESHSIVGRTPAE
jgi:hypothetical protein